MVKRKQSDQYKSQVSELLERELEKQGMSITDLHQKILKLPNNSGVTFESVRSLVRGVSSPSRFVARDAARALGIPLENINMLAMQDRAVNKFGPDILKLQGRNPELEPLERVWNVLSKEHKQDIIAMAQTFAMRDANRNHSHNHETVDRKED